MAGFPMETARAFLGHQFFYGCNARDFFHPITLDIVTPIYYTTITMVITCYDHLNTATYGTIKVTRSKHSNDIAISMIYLNKHITISCYIYIHYISTSLERHLQSSKFNPGTPHQKYTQYVICVDLQSTEINMLCKISCSNS